MLRMPWQPLSWQAVLSRRSSKSEVGSSQLTAKADNQGSGFEPNHAQSVKDEDLCRLIRILFNCYLTPLFFQVLYHGIFVPVDEQSV